MYIVTPTASAISRHPPITAVCQPHPSISQKIETTNAGTAMIRNPRFIFPRHPCAPCSRARYGRYVAAVTSDSHTVMLAIAAPFGVSRICSAARS